jgi:hypothetical protein
MTIATWNVTNAHLQIEKRDKKQDWKNPLKRRRSALNCSAIEEEKEEEKKEEEEEKEDLKEEEIATPQFTLKGFAIMVK